MSKWHSVEVEWKDGSIIETLFSDDYRSVDIPVYRSITDHQMTFFLDEEAERDLDLQDRIKIKAICKNGTWVVVFKLKNEQDAMKVKLLCL